MKPNFAQRFLPTLRFCGGSCLFVFNSETKAVIAKSSKVQTKAGD